jgi:hypothetical protein
VPAGAAVRSCRSRLRTVADAPVAARRRRCDAARQSGAAHSRHRTPYRCRRWMCTHAAARCPILRPGSQPPPPCRDRQAGRCLAGRAQRRPPHRPPRRPKAATGLHLSKPGCRHSNVDEGDVACGCPAPCRNRSRSSWPCPGRRRCSPAARIVEQQRAAERRRKVTLWTTRQPHRERPAGCVTDRGKVSHGVQHRRTFSYARNRMSEIAR